MKKQYYATIETICYIVIAPILYYYIIFMYDNNSDPRFIPIVIFIVLPVISSCSAAFFYEKKIGVFIPLHELIKSCFLLLIPHTFINFIILYLFTDNEIELALLFESVKISGVQMVLIFLPVLLFGKTINKILLDWNKK